MNTLEKSFIASAYRSQAKTFRPRKPPGPREYAMKDAYESGEVLKSIGTRYGISRERVRQIISHFWGLSAKDGGISMQRDIKAGKDKFEKDLRYILKYGHGFDIHAKHKAEFGTKATRAFSTQRKNAQVRGIAWQFNFAEWFKFWQDSGHWLERGVNGYVMCRKDDVGPYSMDNCFIATSDHNIAEYKARSLGYSNIDHYRAVYKRKRYKVTAGRLERAIALLEQRQRAFEKAKNKLDNAVFNLDRLKKFLQEQ